MGDLRSDLYGLLDAHRQFGVPVSAHELQAALDRHPRPSESDADRAVRIRALAAIRVLEYLSDSPDEDVDAEGCSTALSLCARVIDTLDSLPVPPRKGGA